MFCFVLFLFSCCSSLFIGFSCSLKNKMWFLWSKFQGSSSFPGAQMGLKLWLLQPHWGDWWDYLHPHCSGPYTLLCLDTSGNENDQWELQGISLLGQHETWMWNWSCALQTVIESPSSAVVLQSGCQSCQNQNGATSIKTLMNEAGEGHEGGFSHSSLITRSIVNRLQNHNLAQRPPQPQNNYFSKYICPATAYPTLHWCHPCCSSF